MIKTVVFDIGDVLMHVRWMDWALETYGEETRDALAKVFWRTSYWDELDKGTWMPVHFLAQCIERAPEYEAEIKDSFKRVGECMIPADYAIPWVKELKEKGYRVLYLSNYCRYLRRIKPEVLEFLPYTDGGVFSCDVQMLKPDAAIYARLCAEYDLDPKECLFIDDREKNVEAARAYGMHGMVFESYEVTRRKVNDLLDRSRAGRPLIGVLPLWDEEKKSIWMLPGYMDGILAAGGLPMILPLTEDPEVIRQLAHMCDGFLFTGGQDVDPSVYLQEVRVPNLEACPMRDKLEEPLLEWILKLDKPALGICRGLQFFNGALGGDLYQDLPLEHPEGICHRQTVPGEETCHRVKLIKGSPLAELLGKETLEVNSLHHQAVRKLSPCLRMMAQSEDGLCEAAYMPGQKFIWAVQWHPEFRYSFDEDAGKLFEALIRATEI